MRDVVATIHSRGCGKSDPLHMCGTSLTQLLELKDICRGHPHSRDTRYAMTIYINKKGYIQPLRVLKSFRASNRE